MIAGNDTAGVLGLHHPTKRGEPVDGLLAHNIEVMRHSSSGSWIKSSADGAERRQSHRRQKTLKVSLLRQNGLPQVSPAGDRQGVIARTKAQVGIKITKAAKEIAEAVAPVARPPVARHAFYCILGGGPKKSHTSP